MSIVYDDRPPSRACYVDDFSTALKADAAPRLAAGRCTAVITKERTGNTIWVTVRGKPSGDHQTFNRADMENVVEEFSRLLEEDGV